MIKIGKKYEEGEVVTDTSLVKEKGNVIFSKSRDIKATGKLYGDTFGYGTESAGLENEEVSIGGIIVVGTREEKAAEDTNVSVLNKESSWADSKKDIVAKIGEIDKDINYYVTSGKWREASDLSDFLSKYLIGQSKQFRENDPDFAKTLLLSHSYWNLAAKNYRFLADKKEY